jgi:bifunctional non-homologous end joining protein LigD
MDATKPPARGRQAARPVWPRLPRGLQPMLAVPVSTLPAEPGWTFEPKWDGYRGIGTLGAGASRILSRRGNDMAAWFPELTGLAGALDGHQALVDGELVALDAAGRPDFAALQQRASQRTTGSTHRRVRPAEVAPVVYIIFDLLGLDGRLLLERPWAERRARLEALELAGPVWQTSPSFVDQGPLVWAATARQGLEGVVAKRVASPYRPGRRHPDWQKRSHEQQEGFLVGGYVPGPVGVGRLLVGTRQPDGRLRHVATVAAGLVPAARRRLAALLAGLHTDTSPFAGPIGFGRWGGRPAETPQPLWVRPELEVLIAYRGLEGGQLRHARYAGLPAEPR